MNGVLLSPPQVSEKKCGRGRLPSTTESGLEIKAVPYSLVFPSSGTTLD